MKSNLLAWLVSTGLDEQRAELYLVALSKGEATASELAVATKLNRTAVYDNLRVLESRGYVKTVCIGKRKVFVALHPKELHKRFDALRDQLKDLLPDFLAIYAEKSSAPFVQSFTGPFASREVFEDILNSGVKDYVYFSSQGETIQTVDRAYMEKWVARRVAARISSRSLRVKLREVKGMDTFNNEATYLRQIRYLPGYVDLTSSIYIYGRNVAVISTKKENAAFIIHSADFSFSFKQLFEFLWSVSVRT
jgi:sugar-specific transcriptional regulator TrmB